MSVEDSLNAAAAPDRAGELEFCLLGPLEVRRNGCAIELGPRKQRALLALLLLEANQVVARDRLVEELWAGAPPAGALKTLRSYISRLRALLGSDLVVSRAPGYLLQIGPNAVDASRFEQLSAEGRRALAAGEPAGASAAFGAALELWRGPALADFTYEPFAQEAIARLEELRLGTVEERIEAELACGRDAELVPELESLVDRYRFRERARAQLMLALYRSGRQSEALEAYREGRQILAEELGIEPSPQLKELEALILRHDPSLLAPARLPAGTVTFVFTDVEGSTRLLAKLGELGFSEALTQHRRVVREACAQFGGVEIDTQGDSFFVAFSEAPAALNAARAMSEQLAASPISVRIGVHTGTPLLTAEGYVGADVHRAARIAASGHGGQVLVSASTAALVDLELQDLGEHRFKDLAAPERVFQLGMGEFPPLRSLRNVRLPVPATPFLGRQSELASVAELLEQEDLRLLTLVGPGGTGKTRLALQAAAEAAADRFPDGTWWVALAPLRDPGLTLTAVAQTLGLKEQSGRDLKETLLTELGTRRLLLVLDNAEHLLPELAGEIAELGAATGVTVLVTSRERLRLQAERVYPVPTLAERDSIELFLARARALDPAFEANGSVGELCARLDHLPLALELAAARTILFSPQQLLQRLSQRLDLLKGGRDAEPRQQTLRATIAWSYDLLSPGEQRLFRSLSVFAGGCSYEAAEQVAGGDPDTLQSLLDKSLLRRRDSPSGIRYGMLETIREYAAERLEQSGDEAALRLRHAEWCCELADRVLGPNAMWVRDEDLSDFEADHDNVRSALAWAWRSGHPEYGLRLASTFQFWTRNALFQDAVAWLEAAKSQIEAGSPAVQLKALRAAGLIAQFVLADPEQAERHWVRALSIAEQLDETDQIRWLEDRRAGIDWERGDLESSVRHFQARVERYRADGNRRAEADALHMLGESLRDLGRFDEAAASLEDAAAVFRELGLEIGLAQNIHSRADLALDRGDRATALALYREALTADRRLVLERQIAYCLAGIASVLAQDESDEAAAVVWGAVCSAERALGFRMLTPERRRYERYLKRLENTPAWNNGRQMTLKQATESIDKHLAATE